MKKVSRIHIFILALSIAYSPAKAIDWEKVGIGACIVGAAAGLVSVIWAACAPESNEHMLERIQHDYDDTSFLMPYVNACQTSVHTSSYGLHEEQLYAILHRALNNTDIADLEYKVQRALRDLASGKRELEKRIRENTESKPSYTLEAMKVLVAAVSQREDSVNTTLKTLFDYHGVYFKVVQLYDKICRLYADEISVLHRYPYDKTQSHVHLKSIVSGYGYNNKYPFITFYECAVSNQKYLRNFINTLSHAYPDIMHKAQQLLRDLDYMSSIIVTSSEYTQDILHKEQDAIREAQRQLAAQQERFRREQERARHEMRMAQIDLAIQQIAFKKEQKKELDKLKKERRKLEQALQSI